MSACLKSRIPLWGSQGSSKELGDNSIKWLRKFEITPVTMKACRLMKAARMRNYKVGDHVQVKLSGEGSYRGIAVSTMKLSVVISLTCILAISCLLFLQKLGNPYITLWDEAVHVNVIKNLAENCCLPQLHRSAEIGTDYRHWINNTLWLHKPLLPFYVTAGIYKLLGGSLWALRLPGAIFALLTTVVIYFIGRDFLSGRVGLCAAAIFSLNPYTNQLVHGREFSGFPDLFFAFFVSVAPTSYWTGGKADLPPLYAGSGWRSASRICVREDWHSRRSQFSPESQS